jgi:hypothetical protein
MKAIASCVLNDGQFLFLVNLGGAGLHYLQCSPDGKTKSFFAVYPYSSPESIINFWNKQNYASIKIYQ